MKACHYAIIRFLPFVETGEFANVGVVLFCPSGRFFGFRLLQARHARITNFFEQLEPKVFKSVMRQARAELVRVSDQLKPLGTDRRFKNFDREATFALWSELTKPLASVLRMSEPRLVMAESPEATLSELFAFYVERNFVTKEYQEEILTRNVRGLLRRADLVDRYTRARVGNDEYHVVFPFVAFSDDEYPVQAIKPLSLAHQDTTRIIDHGGQWVHRIASLLKRRLLPNEVLIAYEGDDVADTAQGQARRDVLGELSTLPVVLKPMKDTESVIQFAEGVRKYHPRRYIEVQSPQFELASADDVSPLTLPHVKRGT